MNIGSLNKRITIQSETKTADGMGGWIVVMADVATIWAAIWPLSANETVAASANTMMITHRIRIRYRSDIKASYRIKFGARYFAIISIINPNEKNQMLDLLCKEASG
jgi:SPP1 family predicted phage head-tail adaptor